MGGSEGHGLVLLVGECCFFEICKDIKFTESIQNGESCCWGKLALSTMTPLKRMTGSPRLELSGPAPHTVSLGRF